jgi:hypothetical protein
MGDSESEDSARIVVDSFWVKCPGDHYTNNDRRYARRHGTKKPAFYVPVESCRGCGAFLRLDEEQGKVSCKPLYNLRRASSNMSLGSELEFLDGVEIEPPPGVDANNFWVICDDRRRSDRVFALETGVDRYVPLKECLKCHTRLDKPDFDKGELHCAWESIFYRTEHMSYVQRRIKSADDLQFNTPDAIRFIKLTYPEVKVTGRFDGSPFLKVERRDLDEVQRINELMRGGKSKEAALKMLDEEARQRGETRL